jgi:RNA polymerase sigma factor (sigma-70 family)
VERQVPGMHCFGLSEKTRSGTRRLFNAKTPIAIVASLSDFSYIRLLPNPNRPHMAPEKNELRIVELLKDSDQKAFDTVFRLYSSRVYWFAFGYLKCREEAEEIVQDTFIKIWQNRATLDPSHSISGFLFTIAHNLILNRIRKLRNQAVFENKYPLNPLASSNPTQEKMLTEDLERIRGIAVSQLPPRRKMIFQLVRENEMSYQESGPCTSKRINCR